MDRAAALAALSQFLSGHSGTITVHVDTDAGKDVLVIHLPPCLPPGLCNDCQRDIYLTLKEVGHRLTTSQLLAEMEKRSRKYGESWVKENLSDMVEVDVLDNLRESPRGKGYGLPGW